MPIDLDSVRQVTEAAGSLQRGAAEQDAHTQRYAERLVQKEEDSTGANKKHGKKNNMKDACHKKAKKKRKKKRPKEEKKKGNKRKKAKRKRPSSSSESSSEEESCQAAPSESQVAIASRQASALVCRTGAAEARLAQSNAAPASLIRSGMCPKTRAQEIIRDIALQRLEKEHLEAMQSAQKKAELEAKQRELDETRSAEWRRQAEEKAKNYCLSDNKQDLGLGSRADSFSQDASSGISFAKAKEKFDAALASFERSDDMFAGPL